MPKKPDKFEIAVHHFVPIVSDAALAGPVADGRMIPLLILDTRHRPEVAELIRVHKHLPPGDVTSLWGKPETGGDDDLSIVLDFARPMETRIALKFSIERQGGLVDLMVAASATYLQAGAPGDRLATTMDEPRIFVELVGTEFAPIWDVLWLDRIKHVLGRDTELSEREIDARARARIAEFRKLGGFRMPR